MSTQDRVNARREAAAERRTARSADNENRRQAVEQKKTDRQAKILLEQQTRAENQDLDEILYVCDGFNVKAVRRRDLALNTSDTLSRRIQNLDKSIQVKQNIKQSIAKRDQKISQKLSSSNSRKSVLENRVQQKQTYLDSLPNTTENARIKNRTQRQIANLNKKISDVTSVIANNTSQAQRLAQQGYILDTAIEQKTSKKDQIVENKQTQLRKALEQQSEADKQKDIKQITREKRNLPPQNRQDCICPTVYDPVVIAGVTYSNSCLAQCAGVTVPPNAPKPQPPLDRKCLQVITCGSDGNTYPTSCLPVGVYPVSTGGPCSGPSVDPVLYQNPFTRPPVSIITGTTFGGWIR